MAIMAITTTIIIITMTTKIITMSIMADNMTIIVTRFTPWMEVLDRVEGLALILLCPLLSNQNIII